MVKLMVALFYQGLPLSNKGDELLIQATTWKDLKGFVLSEEKQSRKVACCHFYTIFKMTTLEK